MERNPATRVLPANAIWCLCLIAGILGGLLAPRALGDEKPAPWPTALLKKYCVDCHGGQDAESNVHLDRLASKPDFARRFKTWDKVLAVLQQKRMPPEDESQPSDAERRQLIAEIRGGIDAFARKHQGDPGRVVIRRLTSAEYAYTVRDLTGLDLGLQHTFVSDAVGGEGFTNVGEAQFIQDSTLQRYLEAAKIVASHAVIGAGPLQFYADPGKTGRELSAIHRVQAIYRAHGFRTAAGEGAEPFGLDRYPRAFFVAWQYRHRERLGLHGKTLADLAAEENLDARFVEHIWSVFNRPSPSSPTSEIVAAWRKLPAPQGARNVRPARLRSDCRDLYARLRGWQKLLATAAGDDEEVAVLTAGPPRVSLTHSFTADFDWPEGIERAMVRFSVVPAARGEADDAIVVWRQGKVRFQDSDNRWTDFKPLAEVLPAQGKRALALGQHPRGAKIAAGDFVVTPKSTARIEFPAPAGMKQAQLLIEAVLDVERGADCVVRCTISDESAARETAADTGTVSTLLADPAGAAFKSWIPGVVQFAGDLPEISHREPAPSDRDPIPAPYDNTYNRPERNDFHYQIKYHRDDRFLVEHILDDATRKRLDEAWVDLLTSFDYHDTFVRFVAGKYKLNLPGSGVEDLDRAAIERLPAEPRGFVRRLYDDYTSAQRALQAARAGHLDGAIRLAALAWRRPLRDEEEKRLRAFYASMRDDTRDGAGLDHTKAMRALLARIFVSPAFLYRAERPAAGRGIVSLRGWELANRLSFFLWSSGPDAELRRAASAGELQDAEQLVRQARRMLRDEKARRLASEFFGQWFGFYRFDGYRGVDPERFPEFTPSLKAAMHDEAVSFFEHIIRQDRPTREILFADYSFLNRELAEHYGIETKVALTEQPKLMEGIGEFHRGGLLRLGAVLTVTSAPLRTSAVKRGDWVLRRVLGTPVPPPPPDAGSIAADDVLAGGRTIRERLVAHRKEATCANCHARIDPLGFALEHFDAVGRWRDTYRDGRAIDVTGTLRDGTKINGPDGLRRYLRSREQDFRRTLCAKLLGYALGRSELLTDRVLIEQMMAGLDSDDRFSQLVERVVSSRQFRHRRGRDEAPLAPPEKTAPSKQQGKRS